MTTIPDTNVRCPECGACWSELDPRWRFGHDGKPEHGHTLLPGVRPFYLQGIPGEGRAEECAELIRRNTSQEPPPICAELARDYAMAFALDFKLFGAARLQFYYDHLLHALREAHTAGRREMREEAARVCEALFHLKRGDENFYDAMMRASNGTAQAIRALPDERNPEPKEPES